MYPLPCSLSSEGHINKAVLRNVISRCRGGFDEGVESGEEQRVRGEQRYESEIAQLIQRTYQNQFYMWWICSTVPDGVGT